MSSKKKSTFESHQELIRALYFAQIDVMIHGVGRVEITRKGAKRIPPAEKAPPKRRRK